ncbi:MAG: YceI family protein [Devosia sp.]
MTRCLTKLMAAPLAAGALLLSAAADRAYADAERFEIDTTHFSIVFSADHIEYGNTWGMFLRGGGSFMYDEDTQDLSDLSVTIETASVFTNNDRRDEHVRSEDFLDADAHPDITFVMTGSEKESDTAGKVMGDLTVRGVTKPVTLDVTLNKIGPYPFGNNYVVGVTAKTMLKRSDFGSTYALEGNLVGDEIPIIIELEAIRQDDPA